MKMARAFWAVSPGRGEIRDEPLREPAVGQVEVEALYSGISRGTETLVFAGRVPESEHERMRAPHQDGAFPFPVKYGYASVGRVVAGEPDLVGKSVFCLYPHQTRYVVAADQVHILPENVPPARAVLAANVETAINGTWDAGISVGDRVAVIGGGVVGCLVAYLAAHIPGCDVTLVDIDPARADIATALGARFALPEQTEPGADAVIHTSGNPAGLRTALSLAATEAVITELSWFGDREAALPLGAAFHSQRLTIRSSQVGTIPATHQARWTYRRRLALALSLLTDPTLDTLITHDSPFEDLPKVMPTLAQSNQTLCHRLRYP